MHRSLPLATAVVCGVAVFATIPLAGCGGGSVSSIQSGAQLSFAGRSYASVLTLAAGQTGTLALSTSTDGTVSGTFSIDDSNVAAGQRSRLVIATPLLSGTFNPVTGAFNLSGAYIFNGRSIPISVQGIFPIPPATTGGSITVTTEGHNYSSTFGAGVPVTPTPGPSATPLPTPSPTASPNPGGTNFRFTLVSKSADCNFSDAGFTSLQFKEAKLTGGSSLGLYAFNSKLTTGNTTVLIGWQRLHASSGLIPESFTYVPTPAIGAFGDDFQGILQTAIVIPVGTLSAGAWSPTGGRLIVESVVGKTVHVRGENVEFSPNRFNAISAKGTFTANFDATFENVEGL